MIRIVFEEDNKRAAAYDGDKLAGESTYSDGGQNWIIDHTEVDPSYSGLGIARKLVFEIVKAAREKNVKIIPLCPYAKKEFENNKEYWDVLRK
ncbi:MAG: GNAT family N-acetyltransferase [Tissierellia bacterium]|nr:GNAT family N-acetyltransferase [Tissierellia bacterium]